MRRVLQLFLKKKNFYELMMVQTIHTVAMDTTVLEVDNVELLPLQGRVVVILVDMGTLGVVDSYQRVRQHNQLEGVG